MADDPAAASLRLARELQAQFDAEAQAEAAEAEQRRRRAAAPQPPQPIVSDSSIDEEADDDSSRVLQTKRPRADPPVIKSETEEQDSTKDNKRRRVDDRRHHQQQQQQHQLLQAPLSSSSSSSSSCSVPYDAVAFYRNRIRGLNNEFAISITDVVQGDIVRAVLLNYCWELQWLLSACPVLLSVPQVDCVAGAKFRAKASLQAQVEQLQMPNIRCFLAALPLPFSCHHSKLMLLLYPAGLRLVLLTANFLACDLLYKNQAIFVQDFPLKRPQAATASASSAPSTSSSSSSSFSSAGSVPSPSLPSPSRCELGDDFERSLCEYFSAYVSCGLDVRAELRRFDYSAAYGVLIPSAPGLYKGRDMERWGHTKVRAVLEREEMQPEMQRQPVVAQFSSIGSVRPNVSQQPQSSTALHSASPPAAPATDGLPPAVGPCPLLEWLTELCRSLGSHRGLSRSTSPPAVRLVWPTVRDVQQSLEGWIAGGSLCCNARNHRDFMRPLYRRWDGSGTGRHRAAPHIKSYSRSRQQEAAFVLVSSANLSAAAWGDLQKGGRQLAVRHYELGILLTQRSIDTALQRQQPAFSCTPDRPVHGLPPPVGSSSASSQQPQPPLRRRAQLWLPLLSDAAGAAAASEPVYRVICPLPYSVTSAAYSSTDEPWAWDRDREEEDCRGATFTRVGSGDD